MSKWETPLIKKYWEQIGGTLIEEFPVVRGYKNSSKRALDAIIIPEGENAVMKWHEVDIKGKEIIVVQAKAMRLGMYLMGQALFSKQLLEKFYDPKKVISVALCTKDDAVLRSLLEQYPDVKVVIVEKGVR